MGRQLILDTDMGNDIDDVLALAALHSLHKRGDIDLAAILVSKDAPNAPRFTDLFNKMVGQPIPVAKTDRGVAIPFETYLHLTDLFGERHPKQRKQLPDDYPLATDLLRDTLRNADDGSVDLVTIGFASNIGDFVQNPEDAALLNSKVARVTMMAGNFEKPQPEFNVMMDVPAFEQLLTAYNGPITFVGFELGRVRYPEASIRRLYEAGMHEMIWLSYFSYASHPHHRQCWDPLTALVASGCFEDAYSLSEPGVVTVDDAKATQFTPNPKGRHRFVTLTPAQERQMKQSMMELIETL